MSLLLKRKTEVTITAPRRVRSLIRFGPVVLAAMVALLTTAAILQFRWMNEASAATEMRIGAELESLLMKWHGDLYGEFSALCVALQVGPDSGARDSWGDYLERYAEWRNALSRETLINIYSNPDLVRDVYIWDTNLGATPQLYRLNAENKKIEAASEPEDLRTLLARLRGNSANLSTSLRVWKLDQQDSDKLASNASASIATSPGTTGWLFDESVPAIVHPIFQRDARSLNSLTPVDWMVIALNWRAIQSRLFPELAARHFGGMDGLEYRVAVVATGPSPRTIFSSDPGFGIGDLAAADSRLYIFGPRPTGVENQPIRAATAKRSRNTVSRDFSGPVWFPVIEYDMQPNPWVLVLQHRTGPLQAVIQNVWRKNLAMSAFVFVLLALSIGILVTLGFQAQKFAHVQMDFVASMSHELRTPLTAIFAAGENIKDGVVNEQSDLSHYGSIVMDQSRQLMEHVNRILMFASIRSGKERYNLRPLEVTQILERARRSVWPQLKEEGCTLEEFIEPDLPQVTGDLLAACSCVENLLTNAIKYSRNDRRVRIGARLQELPGHPKQVLISVEDHGIGIARSELNAIFKPFYRSPAVTEEQIHGTGLGLSLAKHLAEAMGGSLTVSSEVGVGSIFTLSLQVAATPELELSAVGKQAIRSKGNE